MNAILVKSVGTGVAATGDTDPLALYGDEIVFDVLRKGEMWGRIPYGSIGNGRALFVESRFELAIKILFIPVYSFSYLSTARWRDDTIEFLDVDVDDNGERFFTSRLGEEDATEIRSSNGQGRISGQIFPTNHWNADVLRASKVLNTLTGKMNNVRIEARGQEYVPTEEGDVKAMRYAYTGELETEVWHDQEDRWVKMRFVGKDGVLIDYILPEVPRPQRGNNKEMTTIEGSRILWITGAGKGIEGILRSSMLGMVGPSR